MSRYKGPRVKFTLRMPNYLRKQLAQIATARGITLSDLMLEMITQVLERDDATQQNSERSA